jgi:opacity protein-like surface antigen
MVGFDNIVSFGPVSLRAELEGMAIGKRDIVTDSFQPPVPTFFYQTSVRSYAGLVNLWADVRPMADIPVVLSAGGGVGFAHHEIKTTDFVVTGNGSDTTFAYALGVQAAYEFAPTVSVGVMGRYTDFGEPSIDLKSGGVSIGDYSLNHSGVQVMGFLRFHFGAD